MPRLGVRTRADGSTHVRPALAVVLSLAVWVLCGALLLQAVMVAGVDGLLLAPGPLLVCAMIWAVLWEPRVVVHRDGLEVRNVLRRVVVPFSRVEDVRLGAMLRVLVRDDAGGSPRAITAWNAPGTGRDRMRDRLVRAEQDRRSPQSTRPRADWGARLRADQESSASFIAVLAWRDWRDGPSTQEAAPPSASAAGSGASTQPIGGDEVLERTRWGVIGVLALCMVLVVLRIAL